MLRRGLYTDLGFSSSPICALFFICAWLGPFVIRALTAPGGIRAVALGHARVKRQIYTVQRFFHGNALPSLRHEMHINVITHLQSRFFSSDDEITDCPHSSLPSSELRDEELAMTAAKICNEENKAKVSSEGEKETTVSNEEEKEEDDANMNPGSPLPNSMPKKCQTVTDA